MEELKAQVVEAIKKALKSPSFNIDELRALTDLLNILMRGDIA